MSPLQILFQSFPGTFIQSVHHLSILIREKKAQQVSLLSFPKMSRRSVFTLESEAGVRKKGLGLLQNLKTFGHVLGQVDQVIGVPEPGRIRAILLESKIVYVMQANILTGGRVGISLLDSLLPVLM